MSSYTPGPYLFEKQHHGKYLVLAERPNKCPIEVAECFSEPNARLFAAAPEMYECLKAFMYAVDTTRYLSRLLDDAYVKADALLRRIDGEEETE